MKTKRNFYRNALITYCLRWGFLLVKACFSWDVFSIAMYKGVVFSHLFLLSMQECRRLANKETSC